MWSPRRRTIVLIAVLMLSGLSSCATWDREASRSATANAEPETVVNPGQAAIAKSIRTLESDIAVLKTQMTSVPDRWSRYASNCVDNDEYLNLPYLILLRQNIASLEFEWSIEETDSGRCIRIEKPYRALLSPQDAATFMRAAHLAGTKSPPVGLRGEFLFLDNYYHGDIEKVDVTPLPRIVH